MAGLRRTAVLTTAVAAACCWMTAAHAAAGKLANQGLLVGYVHSDEYPDAKVGSPVVGTKIHHGAQDGGVIVLALKPGEHDLSAIYRHQATYTIATAVGNMYLNDFDAFKLGRKVRIEAGKVTNVGMIVVRGPQPVNGTPNAIYLDNARDMQDIVASAYPEFFASLQAPDFKAQGQVESAAVVQALRKTAATRKFSTPKWQSDHPQSGYVAAEYGAIARIHRNGPTPTLTVLPTDTLMDLSECSVAATSVACVLSSTNVLVVEGDQARILAAPSGVRANSVHIANDRELVLLDAAMNIHVSADRGTSWNKVDSPPLAKPTTSGGQAPDNRNAFGMADGRDHDYFYSRADGAKNSQLLARAADGRFERVTLPPQLRQIQHLRDTESGLLIVAVDNGELWHQSRGQTAWEKRKLPQAGCMEVAFGDAVGEHIELACAESKFWTTKDGGRSWGRVFKPQSLFAGR